MLEGYHSILLLTKLPLFYFINKDSGTRQWSENLLAHRGRGSTQQLPSPLTSPKELNSYAFISNKKLLQLNVFPYYFLCISLSIFLTLSYSLWFFFISTGCLLLLIYG